MNEIIVTGRKLQLSEATRRLNPHLFKAEAEKAACAERVGRVVRTERERSTSRALDNHLAPRQSRKKGVAIVHVLIVSYRKRLTDDDNSGSGQHKALRDEIAKTIEIDDGDSLIKFDYAQVVTCGITGTNVVISRG
jgi:hypothetical protein